MVEQGKDINGYYTYKLPEGVVIDNIFYVGWRQRSETFLNAGFDVNTPNRGRQFFWLNGNWNQSMVGGSLMIRPVVGDRLIVAGVNDTPYKGRNSIKIWPNPASSLIHLDSGDQLFTGIAYINIIDLSGRQLIRIPYSEQVDISSLQKGVYILVVTMNGNPLSYNRIVKTK